MNKSGPEYLKLADQCLKQFAQTSEDALASLLSTEILNAFEKKSTSRVRNYPALGSGLNLLYCMDIDPEFDFINQQANHNIMHFFYF